MTLLTLDKHTAPLFAPESHSGAIETTLDLIGFGFEARVANDISGFNRVVMQLQDDPARGVFVLRPIPRWNDLAQQGPSEMLWEKIRTLPEKMLRVNVDRMCSYQPEECLVLMHQYCYGGVLDLNNAGARPIGFAFGHQRVPPEFKARTWEEFVAWNADAMFAVIEQAARYPQSELAQTLDYLRTDDEFKAQEIFGCSFNSLKAVNSLLRASLIIEMAKGDLGKRSCWRYWLHSAYALKGCGQLPEFLTHWKTRVCTALSCRELNMSIHQYINTTANYRITGPENVTNRWLAPNAIEVSAPTAHEALEAHLQLREFERAYPT